MKSDTRGINQGDLFWAQIAKETSHASAIAHPHLVIQDDLFNHSRIETVIVCALTTRLQCATEPGNILLQAGEGNLPKQSVIVVSQLSSLPKSSLGGYIGSLSSARVAEVLAGIRFQQSAFFRA